MKVKIYDQSNSELVTEVALRIGGFDFESLREWAETEAWQVAIEGRCVEKTRKRSDFYFEFFD